MPTQKRKEVTMSDPLPPPSPSFDKGCNKDKIFEANKEFVFAMFRERPKSVLMVEDETSVYTSVINKHIRQWEKEGKVQVWKIARCRITHRLAAYYTTDINLFTYPSKPCSL